MRWVKERNYHHWNALSKEGLWLSILLSDDDPIHMGRWGIETWWVSIRIKAMCWGCENCEGYERGDKETHHKAIVELLDAKRRGNLVEVKKWLETKASNIVQDMASSLSSLPNTLPDMGPTLIEIAKWRSR